LVFLALKTQGVGIPELNALWLWHHFIAARQIDSNLSERDGMALSKTIRLGTSALPL